MNIRYCPVCCRIYPYEYISNSCECGSKSGLRKQKDMNEKLLKEKCFCVRCGRLRKYVGHCQECGSKMVRPENQQQNFTRNNIIYKQPRKENQENNPTNQSNIPKCPTCQSTKIKKISDLKKATGFMMVGIFSSNFGKTMECENCGYKW